MTSEILGEKMEKISYKFKRNPFKEGEKPTIEALGNDLMINISKALPKRFIQNAELFHWFGTFLSISAYSGLADEISIEQTHKKPMSIMGTSETIGDVFKASVHDNGFALASTAIKNIEEFHVDSKTGLAHMLDITPNTKTLATDYDETIQYSISQRGKYSITILEEVPHTMDKFPHAEEFPTTSEIGGFMKFYYSTYLKAYPLGKNPISTHASFSYAITSDLNDKMQVKSLFDIVTLDGLFVIKVNGEEYMRTQDLNEVKGAIQNHPDIASALRENDTVKAYLDKFIKSYENVKKTGFLIKGMLG